MVSIEEAMVAIAGYLRERGRAGAGELVKLVGATRRRTVYRALRALEGLGLIRREGRGRYVWYSEELKKFEDLDPSKAAWLAKHYAVLRRTALTLSEVSSKRLEDLERKVPGPELECLLEHLRTGYPEAYGEYLRLREVEASIKGLKGTFTAKVLEIAGETVSRAFAPSTSTRQTRQAPIAWRPSR